MTTQDGNVSARTTSSRLAPMVRPFVIVMGFLSTAVGTLGSYFYVEPLNQQVRALTDRKDGAVHEIGALGALATEYFLANQQGDLIFALSVQGNARQDIVRDIYLGNMLDRAEPVRNLIAALALAGQLDYREVYGVYEHLNDAARQAPGDYPAFARAKAFEKDVVERAQKRVAELQLGLVPLGEQLTQAESELHTRQAALMAFSVIGAFLLLLANLIEHRAASGSGSERASRGS
jgi:hypothetical protein